MAKETVFTMKLEPELRAEFMAATKAADRPASSTGPTWTPLDLGHHQVQARTFPAAPAGPPDASGPGQVD